MEEVWIEPLTSINVFSAHALLRLRTPLQLNKFVSPVSLPSYSRMFFYNSACVLLGHGTVSVNENSGTKIIYVLASFQCQNTIVLIGFDLSLEKKSYMDTCRFFAPLPALLGP